MAPGSTAHDYFQQWAELRIFDQLWSLAVEIPNDFIGLDREWQSVDGAMTKARLGGDDTGRNPTDRRKLGTKRTLQTDGGGVPIGLAAAGANMHDTKFLQQTIEDSIERTVSEVNEEEYLCLDKAYDSAAIRDMIVSLYQYTTHVRSRGEDKCELDRSSGERPRRWIVERTHGCSIASERS